MNLYEVFNHKSYKFVLATTPVEPINDGFRGIGNFDEDFYIKDN